ncbi:hypothetical protein IKH79_03835 [Candidatus Saccharibacteria bacterium]|nr:hypothetical protein [Candidatus Saccharibacteria bacterium]
MASKFRANSIAILLVIIAGAGCILGAVILPSLKEQSPSDCTSLQSYNYKTKRCREKTADEIKKDREAEQKKRRESEVATGKQNGSVCLSANEAWYHVGKRTCVVFRPGYFKQYNGYLFLDEYENYKNGFVAFFAKKNMMSWQDFLNRYDGKGYIAVYGDISWYEGHPQIKVYDLSQVSYPKLLHCDTSYGCVYSRG